MRRVLAPCALMLALPLAAGAQAAGTPTFHAKGFFLGAGLHGANIKSDEPNDSGDDSGGGLSVYLGWGFTPQLAIFLEGAGSAMDGDDGNWTLSHGELGLRYHFTGATRKFVPFVEGAAGSRMGSGEEVTIGNVTDEMELSGPAFTLGGGFLYYFGTKFALNTSLKWTTGEFTTVKFGNVTVEGFDFDATSSRLTVGLTWFTGTR